VQLLPIDEILRFGDNDFAITVAKAMTEACMRNNHKLRKEKLKLGMKNKKKGRKVNGKGSDTAK
jgi:hypothetical protein